MRQSLPVWLTAVVPATIAGHALTYALGGHAGLDGRHAWLWPVLEGSIGMLLLVALSLAGGYLVKARLLAHTLAERSAMALWPRLAFAQVVLFIAIERAEGTSATPLGCFAQIVVALLAAILLSAFAGVLIECARSAEAASHYLERLRDRATRFVRYDPPTLAPARAAAFGARRFVRPPPQG